MSAVELLPPHEAGPHNPEWFKLRRDGISASEIAAVLGISPWESPFSLYHRKVNGWDTESNADMTAGRYAESAICEWYDDAYNADEKHYIELAGLYASAARRWQLATPDRLVFLACQSCWTGIECHGHHGDQPVSLVEAKYLIGGWDGWGEPGTDDIPVYYRAQGLQQADVLEVDEVHFAAWHGADFRLYRVRRDEKDLRMMRVAGERFMTRLAEGDPPELDGHPATIRALKNIHPSIEDRDIDVPVEFAEGYRRARALVHRASDVLDRYEARARETLGPARRLLCNGHLVCSRSVYDQSGDMVELDSLDTDPPTVDRLNPGRAKTYLTPKASKR